MSSAPLAALVTFAPRCVNASATVASNSGSSSATSTRVSSSMVEVRQEPYRRTAHARARVSRRDMGPLTTEMPAATIRRRLCQEKSHFSLKVRAASLKRVADVRQHPSEVDHANPERDL